MRQYIISYDLYRPGHNYSDLSGAIKRLGEEWDHPLANLWIIDTELCADDIRTVLAEFLFAGDKLYIREAGDDIAGVDIALGSPLQMTAITSRTRAPVNLLSRVLPDEAAAAAPGESHLLTAAT